MCIGSIAYLADVWETDGARVARLSDGRVVSLGFLPEAEAGDAVLLHLGIPVELLELPTTTEGVAS
jgi:hydrogenase maturation factor